MDPWEACLRLEPIKDKLVENGSSFERASFNFAPYRALVVPEDTVIRRGLGTDDFTIYVEKKQTFAGWHDKKLSIKELRSLMGVCMRLNGQSLAIATYGDWGTPTEGARVKLTILLPSDLEVRKRPDLGGLTGLANGYRAPELHPGPGKPKPGWTIIETVPNSELVRI
jgi:hypothetical protein